MGVVGVWGVVWWCGGVVGGGWWVVSGGWWAVSGGWVVRGSVGPRVRRSARDI